MKRIDEVRARCINQLNKAIQSHDSTNMQKYDAVNTFLINDRCFLNVKRPVSINLLQSLGYTEEEVDQIYDELTDISVIQGDFEFNFDEGGKQK